MLYKDYGIVIKQREYADYDRIITVLTCNHGKVVAIAKGVRKLTSNKSASTDLFVKSKFSFAEGKSLDIVTETVVESTYENSKKNLNQISTLFYLAQLLDKLVVEGDTMQSKDIYQLFEKALDILNIAFEQNKSTEILVAAFELHLLKVLGLLPSFYECVNCEIQLNKCKAFVFKSSSGGIICDKCSGVTKGNVSIDVLKSIRYLSEREMEKSTRFNCDDSIINSIRQINKGMLEYYGDLGIKTGGSSFT